MKCKLKMHLPFSNGIQKRKQTKQQQTPGGTMNGYACDSSSENTEDKSDRSSKNEALGCNKIFLNFTREFTNPPRESCKVGRVKDLFKYLSERQDLQEMKVSGWSDDARAEEETQEEMGEEDLEDDLETFYEEKGTPRAGGQRFAMSRDFWYRKLNTLKAQKLDEAALEAKDIPPDDEQTEARCMKWMKGSKVFSSDIPEKPEEIFNQIDVFDKSVAKPVEKLLGKRFVNVYDNRRFLAKESK